ncbi:MAG: hypothetical protein H0X39_13750, partial [Actinobacteria bacterium]|nr:hypothetical protein [Actinomycetota bacterium]
MTTRLLPATVVVLVAAIGLAASNALRVSVPALFVALVAATAGILAAPPELRRLAATVAVVALAGWCWGSARLDSLDRSPLRAEVDRAGRVLVVVTGEPRVGRFSQRSL